MWTNDISALASAAKDQGVQITVSVVDGVEDALTCGPCTNSACSGSGKSSSCKAAGGANSEYTVE